MLATTLSRVVGVVPGTAQKSSGGWCEGSNPPEWVQYLGITPAGPWWQYDLVMMVGGYGTYHIIYII